MEKSPKILVLLVIFFALVKCAEKEAAPKEECTALSSRIVNPNGDSEMALLMREMYDKAEEWKTTGRIDTAFIEKIGRLHLAQPTDSTVLQPSFFAYSQALYNQARLLTDADSLNPELFNSFVNKCMDCHTEYCPGPKRKIAKLFLKM